MAVGRPFKKVIMCLRLEKRVKPTNEIREVYKAFEYWSGELKPPYWSLTQPESEGIRENVVRGEWLQSRSGPGFHFFLREDEAVDWGRIHAANKILKVQVRRITGFGTEVRGYEAGVAQEIYIP